VAEHKEARQHVQIAKREEENARSLVDPKYAARLLRQRAAADAKKADRARAREAKKAARVIEKRRQAITDRIKSAQTALKIARNTHQRALDILERLHAEEHDISKVLRHPGDIQATEGMRDKAASDMARATTRLTRAQRDLAKFNAANPAFATTTGTVGQG
jgi:hypothetical protein